MKNESVKNIKFLMLIAGRKQKSALLKMISDTGGRLESTVYGKGTVKASYLQNLLGLVPEENKVVITCLMTTEKADAAFKTLVEKFDFNKPNTGIAFTIPIELLSF